MALRAYRHEWRLPFRLARRQLGDSVHGPPLNDLAGNWRKAKEFFTKPALSYGEFKQQCVSLRLFAFGGVCGACALSLVIFPPKSSYWVTWGPSYWFSHVQRCFGSAPPLFLSKKLETTVSAPKVASAPKVEQLRSESSAAPAVSPKAAAVPAKPRVLFVLGGPGAKICEHFPQWQHISAGDCLRAERQDPNSKDGELINTCLKDWVFAVAMVAGQKEGKTDFLIDGFPRNLDNVNGWEEVIGDSANVMGVLFFEAAQSEMEKRLLGRSETSGRVDDNLESIRKRFATYEKDSKRYPSGPIRLQSFDRWRASPSLASESKYESEKGKRMRDSCAHQENGISNQPEPGLTL
eukprot:g302.t1